MRKQFGKLDSDGDGTLSFAEMKAMLKKLNPSFSETQLQKLFCEIDSNQNGKIEVKEFLDFIMENKKSKPDIRRVSPRAVSPEPSTDTWKGDVLEAHNERRALHGCLPLKWSDECFKLAKKQADACQKKGGLFHDNLEGPSGRHGQNGYWCSAPGSTADACVESWYNELYDPGYDFEQPGFKSGIGHFTQVVWKTSTHVGMAVSEDGRFVFANYNPAGNFQGRFQENVPRLVASAGASSPSSRKAAGPSSPSGAQEISLPSGHDRRQGRPSPTSGARRQASESPSPTSRRRPISQEKESEQLVDSIITATSMTPEMEKLLEGCPFKEYLERIQDAFKAGGNEVTVERKVSGIMWELTVTITNGRDARKFSGTWMR